MPSSDDRLAAAAMRAKEQWESQRRAVARRRDEKTRTTRNIVGGALMGGGAAHLGYQPVAHYLRMTRPNFGFELVTPNVRAKRVSLGAGIGLGALAGLAARPRKDVDDLRQGQLYRPVIGGYERKWRRKK